MFQFSEHLHWNYWKLGMQLYESHLLCQIDCTYNTVISHWLSEQIIISQTQQGQKSRESIKLGERVTRCMWSTKQIWRSAGQASRKPEAGLPAKGLQPWAESARLSYSCTAPSWARDRQGRAWPCWQAVLLSRDGRLPCPQPSSGFILGGTEWCACMAAHCQPLLPPLFSCS